MRDVRLEESMLTKLPDPYDLCGGLFRIAS